MLSKKQIADSIVEVGKLMYQKGWVAANDGNISVRLDSERILCTPTGVSKGMMRSEDMLIVDLEGRKLEGERACTTEIQMHCTVYKLRHDVNAVVHAHPPVSTGFAVVGRALNLAILPEAVVTLGTVPLADYGLPGTPELSRQLEPFIPNHDALLMANHGVVCYGESLEKAFFRLETVEHLSRISLVAEMLGGPRLLPRREVDRLMAARSRYGIQFPEGAQPEAPIAAEDMIAMKREDRFEITRQELMGMLDEVLRARGVLTD
ncbi:MAG: class II aldolase/adducin family protein [Acidobacteria bacterium]|nr:class II aldolase/adducin family protein [Acidobacteriota bacterium]